MCYSSVSYFYSSSVLFYLNWASVFWKISWSIFILLLELIQMCTNGGPWVAGEAVQTTSVDGGNATFSGGPGGVLSSKGSVSAGGGGAGYSKLSPRYCKSP